MDVTAEVVAAFDDAPDARERELAQAAARHLHAFAVEVGLTREEWMKGIEFLTAIGHITTETRQEFILLSDTMGFSSLVETLVSSGGTEHTVLGPFYVPGSPECEMGASILIDDDPGERVELSGACCPPTGRRCTATLDVWQNATNRLYAVQDPNQSPENLRGIFRTRRRRRVPLPHGPPGAVPDPARRAGRRRCSPPPRRHPWRPAHIHVIVTAPGHQTLTTHIFDADIRATSSPTRCSACATAVGRPSTGGGASFDFVLER